MNIPGPTTLHYFLGSVSGFTIATVWHTSQPSPAPMWVKVLLLISVTCLCGIGSSLIVKAVEKSKTMKIQFVDKQGGIDEHGIEHFERQTTGEGKITIVGGLGGQEKK